MKQRNQELERYNKVLQETLDKIVEILPSVEKFESEYNARYFDLLLHSPYGNAPAREAEAKTVCRVEGLEDKYLEAKLQLRILLTRKDFLFEMSRNLRAVYVTES